MGVIPEKKGKIQNAHGWAESAYRAGGAHIKVDASLLDCLQKFPFPFGQLTVGIDGDFEAPFASLFYQFRKTGRALIVGVVLGRQGSELEGQLAFTFGCGLFFAAATAHQQRGNQTGNA